MLTIIACRDEEDRYNGKGFKQESERDSEWEEGKTEGKREVKRSAEKSCLAKNGSADNEENSMKYMNL